MKRNMKVLVLFSIVCIAMSAVPALGIDPSPASLCWEGDLLLPTCRCPEFCAKATENGIGVPGLSVEFFGETISRRGMSAIGDGIFTDADGIECLPVMVTRDIYEMQAKANGALMDPVAVTVANCRSCGIFAGGSLDLNCPDWFGFNQRVATFGLIYEVKCNQPTAASESVTSVPIGRRLPPAKWSGLLLLDKDRLNDALYPQLVNQSVRIVSRCIDCAVVSDVKKQVILTGWCKIQLGDGDPITRLFEVVITKTGPDSETFRIKVFKWLNMSYGETLYEAGGEIKNGGAFYEE